MITSEWIVSRDHTVEVDLKLVSTTNFLQECGKGSMASAELSPPGSQDPEGTLLLVLCGEFSFTPPQAPAGWLNLEMLLAEAASLFRFLCENLRVRNNNSCRIPLAPPTNLKAVMPSKWLNQSNRYRKEHVQEVCCLRDQGLPFHSPGKPLFLLSP